MIAKRITTKAATPRVARLVKYVVGAQGKLDPRSWTRTADYMLNSGTSSRGEKVGGVRVTNCNTDDPAAACTLIECTQAANTSSSADKTYHLVFSFPPDEEPHKITLDVLHKIEDELVKAIGYSDHQRISAVHIDTDHLHVHVAINKVRENTNTLNPRYRYVNIEPYYDKYKLMETCERLEIELGLTRTNHGLDGREPKIKVKERQAQTETHSGIETLISYVVREVAPAIREAASWQDLHATLAKHGLQIKPRAAGLVIGSKELWIKASQCDRAFSLKKLTDKLGPFEPAEKQKAVNYEPKPLHTYPSSAAMYDQYQRQQLKHKALREYELEKIKYDGSLIEANLQRWRHAQRLLVKVAAKGPTRRAMLKMVSLHTNATRNTNKRTTATRKAKLFQETRFPSWNQWLAHQAEDGNTEAVNILRSRNEPEPMRGNVIAGKHHESIILKSLKPRADLNGALAYNTNDGGLVIDRKTHVQSFRTTQGAAMLALELAAQRFKGQPLIVEGTDEFKKEVARLAGIHGLNVRFADKPMEKDRKAITPAFPKPSRTQQAEL